MGRHGAVRENVVGWTAELCGWKDGEGKLCFPPGEQQYVCAVEAQALRQLGILRQGLPLGSSE